jgi:hypothetical protein
MATGTRSSTQPRGVSTAAGPPRSRFRSSRSRSIRGPIRGGSISRARRAQERDDRLGLAQSRIQPEQSPGSRSASRAHAGRRPRHRAVVSVATARISPTGVTTRTSSPRSISLQADAAAERVADDQYGLLGDRGRRPAGQSDALRAVLSGEARLLPARSRHLRVRRHRRAAAVADPGAEPLAQNGRPFFSRRIGLSRAARSSTSTTAARSAAASALGARRVVDPAGRVRRGRCRHIVRRARKLGVLEESSVGIIATEGNPTGNLDNSLAGVDFLYRNTRLPGGRSLESDVWYQRSDTEGIADEDAAYGMSLRLPAARAFAASSSTGVRTELQSGARIHQPPRHQRRVHELGLHAAQKRGATSNRGSSTSTISASTTSTADCRPKRSSCGRSRSRTGPATRSCSR